MNLLLKETENTNQIVLPLGPPMAAARKYIELCWTAADGTTMLRRYYNDFYALNPEPKNAWSAPWSIIDERTLERLLYLFLETALCQKPNGKADGPFNPTSRKVAKIIKALKQVCWVVEHPNARGRGTRTFI